MLWTGEVTYHDRLHGMAYAASIAIFNCCFGLVINSLGV